METDMEEEVTPDPATLKNELAESEPSSWVEEQILEVSDALLTGKEPPTCHFLSLESISWETHCN